jgi:hypothetical protein
MAQKRIYELLVYTQLESGDIGYIDPATIFVAVDKDSWTESKRITLAEFVVFSVTASIIEDLAVGHSHLSELDYASAGHTGFEPTLTTSTLGALIGGSTNATPNNTDFVATSLTAGGILKKITWTNVKAFLKTYFDTLYTKATGTELDTGTNDAKFATAKALADSNYIKSDETVTLTNKTLDDAKVKTAINAQTGTTYTLVLTDDSKLVTLSNAAAITLTVPTNASVAFPIGCQIDLGQLGAGAVTVGGAGVTINSKNSNLTINGQYVGVSLVKIATDTWLLLGDLV